MLIQKIFQIFFETKLWFSRSLNEWKLIMILREISNKKCQSFFQNSLDVRFMNDKKEFQIQFITIKLMNP